MVLSDGRGILNEGKSKVVEAVRETRMRDVFTVFVIVESEDARESVLDQRVPVFEPGKGGQLKGFEPYMEHFPFPYYIILRDCKNLPYVLSDALRQWVELINA